MKNYDLDPFGHIKAMRKKKPAAIKQAIGASMTVVPISHIFVLQFTQIGVPGGSRDDNHKRKSIMLIRNESPFIVSSLNVESNRMFS